MKKFWNEIEDNILGILLLAMMLLTCVNVFARYVLLSSMPFVEELTNAGLILLSIAGAATAAKRGAHLGLTVLTERMSPSGQKAMELLANALGVIFGVIILYFGIRMSAHEFSLGLKTSGMQWPEGAFGAMIPFGGLFLVIRYAQLFVRTLRGGSDDASETDKNQNETEVQA